MTRKKSHQRGNLQWHNNCWTVRYWEFNHETGDWKLRRSRLEGFDDPKKKKAARKAADDFIAEVNTRNNAPPKVRKAAYDITFKEFVETYWQAYTVDKKHQPTSVDLRDSFLRIHLLPFFGGMKLREVTPVHIADFFARKQGYSYSTRLALYKLLRLLFDIAGQYDVLKKKKSPVRPKRHRPDTEEITKPVLSAAQIRDVLAKLEDEQHRLLCLLLAVTGLRVREAMALRWLDLNAEGCALAVNHTLYKGSLKTLKTKASQGEIVLHPAIAARLVAHREGSSFVTDEDFIFCLPDGSPLDYFVSLRVLHKAIEGVGILRERGKHGFHILRHSAGTLLYEKSRDLKLVQGTLRHADIATTSDIYVHLTDKVLQEGSLLLTREILPDCDLTVTQKSEMVS